MNVLEFDKQYKKIMMIGARKCNKEAKKQKKGVAPKSENELTLVEINMQINALPRAYYQECEISL